MPGLGLARGCRGLGHPLSRRVLLLVLAATLGAALAPAAWARRGGNPLSGRAMWIFELPYTDGGNVSKIIAGAHRYGIRTLVIKSGDGSGVWSQFNSRLVHRLHRAGLRVCAWQYVYGNHPVSEAYVGADAVRAGANCLVIDAEAEYQGKYVSAQTYVHRLRDLIGTRYPVALAGLPYVDFHPSFPYSVFLGPEGAQYNAPQMYWRAIGVSTDAVFAHTYSYNRLYRRRIFPLGQVYGHPPAHQIVRFRKLARMYGAGGVSWWDWDESTRSAFVALSRPAGRLPGYVRYDVMPSIRQGASGDVVVWAQEHLISAGHAVSVDGVFGHHTTVAVKRFQAAHGLGVDGIVGPQTWARLLRYRIARVRWLARSPSAVPATAGDADGAPAADIARAAATGGVSPIVAPVPVSATAPAKRDEIPGSLGAGRPAER